MKNENETLLKCGHCGKDYNGENEGITLHNGETICEDCRDNYSYCEVTDQYYDNDDVVEAYKRNNSGRKISLFVWKECSEIVETENGEYWFEDYTYTAHRNGSRRGSTITISCEDYENGDYFTCEDCGEIFHTDYYNSAGDGVCDSCYSDHYSSCEDCGDSYHVDYGPSCDCGSSDSCDEIHSYSWQPGRLNFRGSPNKLNPSIGSEIEIEAANGSRRDLVSVCFSHMNTDEIYLKEDGSLTNGFEIVTHPATLEAHKKTNIGEMLTALSKSGARSHDTKTCGLHFHLDKREMSEAHMIRFGAFFSVTKEIMEILARRSSDYATFKNKKSKFSDFHKNESDRYAAVNWTPRNTVEVRIFKGTLKADTFFASMELVQAAYLFTHERYSVDETRFEMNIVWSKFERFITKNAANYPHLLKYISEKNVKISAALLEDERLNSKNKSNERTA